jgi:3-hydroxyacyl-CoA dehydrogenase / 3-hydroxy-2-methylbutyryl-CoA dehydrogenase
MNLGSHTALVTGGASGMGAAVARRFAAAGAQVVILDSNGDKAAALAAELGEHALAVQADITSEPAMQEAIRAAVERFGGLHVVVCCAGIDMSLRTMTKNGVHPLDVFEEVIRINLLGTFNVVRLCAAQMAKNEPNETGERGVIVMTANSAAFDGQAGQAAYAASKGGIVSMTLPISRDLSREGIRVCTISPRQQDAAPNLAVEAPPAEFPDTPPAFLRLNKAEELAQLAQHIVENPAMSGETIRVGMKA